MTHTALILGPSGRFSRHISAALERQGWIVRPFDRASHLSLDTAAQGADLIVNGWNPPYQDWQAQLADQTNQIITAARAANAAVFVPGNIYVYGPDMPSVIGPDSPHLAQNPLGRVRVAMEARYKASGVKTIILRAGDFIDTQASGNWFDRVIAAKAKQGRLTYPGPLNRAHAWAYLPDVAKAAAHLAGQIDSLPQFTDLAFEGYTLTGQQMAEAIAQVLDRPMRLKSMNWLPLRIAQPVWPMARHLTEMRYLWQVPHQLDGAALRAHVPNLQTTPLIDAIRTALEIDVHPDNAMVRRGSCNRVAVAPHHAAVDHL